MFTTREHDWYYETDAGAAPGGAATEAGSPPSADAPNQQHTTPEAGGAGVSGAGQEQETGGDKGWLQKLLRSGSSATVELSANGPASRPDVQEGEPATAKADGAVAQAAKPAAEPKPGEGAASMAAQVRAILDGDPNETVQLTRENVRRIAQSLKDRELAAQNERDQTLAAQRAQAAQMTRLKELADPDTGDPDRLAEEVRNLLSQRDVQAVQAERQAEIVQHVKEIGTLYDDGMLQPLLKALPPDVKQKIEDAAPANLIGLPHRTWLFQEGLKALQQHWTAGAVESAKASLRKNEAFKKQVLQEMRGNLPEPELVEAAAASNGHSSDNNTWLRRVLRPGG